VSSGEFTAFPISRERRTTISGRAVGDDAAVDVHVAAHALVHGRVGRELDAAG